MLNIQKVILKSQSIPQNSANPACGSQNRTYSIKERKKLQFQNITGFFFDLSLLPARNRSTLKEIV